MQNSSQPHNVIMENRRELRISGVKDIDSFSETKIVLNTIMGELVVRGGISMSGRWRQKPAICRCSEI